MIPNASAKRAGGEIVDNRTLPHCERRTINDIKTASTRKSLVLSNNQVVEFGGTGIDSNPSSAATVASLYSHVTEFEALALDVKHNMGMVAVDDGGGGTGTLNRDAVRDCQMPSTRCHRKGELIEATRDFDSVFPHRGIGLHDSSPERTQAPRRSGLRTRWDRPRASAITGIRIRLIQ